MSHTRLYRVFVYSSWEGACHSESEAVKLSRPKVACGGVTLWGVEGGQVDPIPIRVLGDLVLQASYQVDSGALTTNIPSFAD